MAPIVALDEARERVRESRAALSIIVGADDGDVKTYATYCVMRSLETLENDLRSSYEELSKVQ